MARARNFGYTYGFVFSDKLPPGFRKPPQAFVGLRVIEESSLLSSQQREKFDYVIADIATDGGAKIEDKQKFMGQLVGRIEQLTTGKHVNILASATALPDSIKSDYDTLWTTERMDRVIKAAKDGSVAMEINDKLHVPSAAFIKRAKAAGLYGEVPQMV